MDYDDLTITAPLPVDVPVRVSAEWELGFFFDDAACAQAAVNQAAAKQTFAIGDAVQLAKANPRVYVPVGAAGRSPGWMRWISPPGRWCSTCRNGSG